MRPVLEFIRRRPAQSLASRVTFLVFLATLLTSLVVTWVSTRSLQGFLSQRIEPDFPAVLTAASDGLDIWYGQRKLEAARFAHSRIVSENYPHLLPGVARPVALRARDEVAEYLSYVIESFPEYRGLLILDAGGRELISVGAATALPPVLRESLGGVTDPTLSNVHHFDGRRLQVASAQVEGPHGRLGSLHGFLRLEVVDALLRSDRLGPRGSLYLVGSDGRHLAPGSTGPAYRRSLPDPGAPARIEHFTGENGERLAGSSVRLEMFGWTLVGEADYDEAFQPSVATMRKVLLINLTTVLLFSVIAWRLALSIVRPVRALSQGARRIAEGETDVAVIETSSHDELGLLTRTFNRMAARLHRNRIELQQSRLSIEAANVRLRGQNEELHRMNEALEQLSITDGLTKLYNHRFFQENLTREIARVARSRENLSLILIDIDNFKQLNDRYGHAAGDHVLCKVAGIMSSIVRESDVLARYGGEEFALVPNAVTREGALGLAEKIRMAIANTDMELEADGKPVTVRVTISIGVASYRRDRKTFFNDADRALYSAKAQGKDCVVVETGESEGDEAGTPRPPKAPGKSR